MNKKHLPLFILLLMLCFSLFAQEKPEADHSYKPLKLSLNEDGSKYVRFILWHQMWATSNNLAVEDAGTHFSTSIRRSRFLAFAQVSPRFLILTHFGLNSLNQNNLTSLGNNGNAPQLFLHDAWTEFKVSPATDLLYIGAGLHYWKGMTRLANQSTLNFMTLDQSRPFVHWHSLAVTDQFARHLGVYAKGEIGKLDYRLALNSPGKNGIQNNSTTLARTDSLVYNGFSIADKEGNLTGNSIIEGYFRYNFMDKESTKLPYAVGTYLGKKSVIALGTGFFFHPDGMYNYATMEHKNIAHFAIDAFMDMPLLGNDCLNAYVSYLNFDYGNNYVSRWAGTGSVFYWHLGYQLPKTKFMPYVAFQSGHYDGFDENTSALDVGLNYFINGHNAKLTLEYHTISNDIREGGLEASGDIQDIHQLRLQAHIFL